MWDYCSQLVGNNRKPKLWGNCSHLLGNHTIWVYFLWGYCMSPYISLIETLKYLCSLESFKEHIAFPKHNFANAVLSDITDGSFIKSNPFHNTSQITFKIQIYIDEFEPVNGMGYKIGIHKTSAIYFIIRNLPPFLNSKLKNIHLLSLLYAPDIKKYGYSTILSKLVSDLKFLETEGIDVDFLKSPKNIKGSLAALSVDNLGANGLLGMVESFSATYSCRHCLCDKTKMQNTFSESEVELRTPENYAIHLQELDQTLENNVFSIKHRCCLNELNYFHIFQAPTADIMHDALEGVAQWELIFIFQFIISENLMAKIQINNKIAAFNFGKLESTNLPNCITFDHETVGQKAAQT